MIVDLKDELFNSVIYKIEQEKMQIDRLQEQINYNMESRLREIKLLFEKSCILLQENNPHRIFSKGYAAVLQKGRIVSDIDEISVNESYRIHLHNGDFIANVKKKEASTFLKEQKSE